MWHFQLADKKSRRFLLVGTETGEDGPFDTVDETKFSKKTRRRTLLNVGSFLLALVLRLEEEMAFMLVGVDRMVPDDVLICLLFESIQLPLGTEAQCPSQPTSTSAKCDEQERFFIVFRERENAGLVQK